MATDLSADPFNESPRSRGTRRLQLLGGDFHFESNSEQLLELVDAAYGGLPKHRLPGKAPKFSVQLQLLPRSGHQRPPAIKVLSGAGFLGAATPRSTCVLLSVKERSALILVSQEMLAHPYHIRYELLEFAVFTLASRAQGLLALHAACLGRDGRGILAIGDSGAGKSTLTLHGLFGGFDVLAEDAVFVSPTRMLASGISNYVHVRSDSLRFIRSLKARQLIENSPIIRRRSGVAKFELDMRRPTFNIVHAPLALCAVLFLSSRKAGAEGALRPLKPAEALRHFIRTQPYAAHQTGWPAMRRALAGLPCFELRRGAHPDDSLPVLDSLLTRG